MAIFKIVLYCLSAIAFLMVLLPLIKKDYWMFRVFDYPRLQKLTILLVLIIAWSGVADWHDSAELLIIALLSIAAIALMVVIFPFTPFAKVMIERVKDKGQPSVQFLVANVYQQNRSFNKLLKLIAYKQPDILFLLETDRNWQDALRPIQDDYPYRIEVPRDNTYGMLFYSKLPLQNQKVRYLIDPEIPSIIADVEFDGKMLRLYGLHPTPPVPQENEFSTQRDAEILLVAKEASEHTGPCIVLGDLNDVAWSYTTQLFLKTSGLLDPRRGRGMYSTFNAHYWLLRWPLDHYFVSGHFRLIDMKVERSIASDHFPISIRLSLHSEDTSEALQPDADDRQLASEKIEAGKQNEPR